MKAILISKERFVNEAEWKTFYEKYHLKHFDLKDVIKGYFLLFKHHPGVPKTINLTVTLPVKNATQTDVEYITTPPCRFPGPKNYHKWCAMNLVNQHKFSSVAELYDSIKTKHNT